MLRRIIQSTLGRDRAPITDWPVGTSAEQAINQMLADIRDNPTWNDLGRFPQICRAMREHALAAPAATPSDRARMDLFLRRIPDRDRQLLQLFNEGRRHAEIAALVGMDVEFVRQRLVQIYIDMRLALMPGRSPDGGGEPVLTHAEQKIA